MPDENLNTTLDPDNLDTTSGAGGGSLNDGAGGDGGETSQTNETFRTIAELNKLAEDGKDIKMTDLERKRVNVAVKRNIMDDDQITQILNGAKPEDVVGSKASDDTQTDDGTQPTNDVSDNDDGATPEDTQGADDGEGGDDDEVEIDSILLQAIGPHLKKADSVEDAVQAIKDLEHDNNRKGEFVNKAKELGVDSVDKLSDTINTLNEIDGVVSKALTSPEGLQSLYAAYNITPPEWLGKPNAGGNLNGQSTNDGATPKELDQFMADLENDGFVNASTFKNMLPTLVSTIQKNVESKFGEQTKQLEGLTKYVNNLSAQTQREQRVAQSFNDSRTIADKFSQFDPELKLTADPQAIWNDSVNAKGELKAKPHAEFPKLQRILTLRKQAIDAQTVEFQQAGIKGQVDPIGYLSKMFITTGQLGKLQDDTRRSVRTNMTSSLARVLQPNVLNKKSRKGGDSSYKIPKSEKDIKKMSPAQRKKFLSDVKSGKLVVEV